MPQIDLATAVSFTQNWREANNTQQYCGHSANEILPNAFLFPMQDVIAILNTPNASGMRVYFGLDNKQPIPQPGGETYPMKLMLVAVDQNGHDIVSSSTESGVFDYAQSCPVNCDPNSPLNQ